MYEHHLLPPTIDKVNRHTPEFIYRFIEALIEELGTKYNIKEIAFDRWGAVQMVQSPQGTGFTVERFGQGATRTCPRQRKG